MLGAVASTNTGQQSGGKALPDPKTFEDNGVKDGPEFDSWLSRMQKKLDSDIRNYNSEEKKIAYIQSRLDGRADSLTQHRFDNDGPQKYKTAKEVFNHLIDLFRNKNKVLDAAKEYRRLYQRARPFAEFYSEFLHLAGQGRIPESTWKVDLIEKMSLELKRQTMRDQSNNKVSYTELAQVCTTLDHQLKELREQEDRIKKRKWEASGSTSTKLVELDRNDGLASTTHSKDPKSLYSFEERKAYAIAKAAEIKCYNCNKMGHYGRDCTEPDRRQQQQGKD